MMEFDGEVSNVVEITVEESYPYWTSNSGALFVVSPGDAEFESWSAICIYDPSGEHKPGEPYNWSNSRRDAVLGMSPIAEFTLTVRRPER